MQPNTSHEETKKKRDQFLLEEEAEHDTAFLCCQISTRDNKGTQCTHVLYCVILFFHCKLIINQKMLTSKNTFISSLGV